MIDKADRLALFLLLSAVFTGCAEYDHVVFSDIHGATDRAALANEGITLVQGYAVAATSKAIDSNNDEMDDLTLHSDDSAPIGVAPGPDSGTYVFYGRTVGTGIIRVRVEGDQVATIPITVVPQ